MTVRVGFIGVGGIAQTHLRNLETIPEARVVAACDVRRDAADAVALRTPGCVAYADHLEMIERAQLDAVYVCLPPFAHRGQEEHIARRGLALFVEKPVALDIETARSCAAAVEAAGVVNSVGYNWRYLETTDAARAELAGRRVALARGTWIGGLPGSAWWRVRAQSGGQAIEQTTHIFDLARYLVGEITSVYARAFNGLMVDVPHYDIDDATTVSLRFADGAIGTIESTDLAPRGHNDVGLTLYARELVVELTTRGVRLVRPGRSEEIQPQASAYLVEDRVFIDAVRTGDRSEIRSTYADAVRTLAATLAAARSVESGAPVEVG